MQGLSKITNTIEDSWLLWQEYFFSSGSKVDVPSLAFIVVQLFNQQSTVPFFT
jgi:hypothetical protein